MKNRENNEHVSATQYDNEAAEENMEVVGSDETHLQYADQRNNDSNGHVSATQYDNEAVEENMEVVGSDERHLQYADKRNNDTNVLNVNEVVMHCKPMKSN